MRVPEAIPGYRDKPGAGCENGPAEAHCQDANDNLDLLRTTNFDMALLDVRMPVLNGDEVVASLRQEQHRGPMIALTSYDVEDHDALLQAGFDAVLTKPISDELWGVLKKRFLS